MGFTDVMGSFGAAGGGGGGGFSFGSLFSNPLVLQMMASMGASLDPEGPAGVIGGVTNQWIQNKSYMDMMKKLLGGGGKQTMDKDSTTWKFPTGLFGSDDQTMSMSQPAFSSGQQNSGNVSGR